MQGAVYDTLPENLPHQVTDLGEHQLKGFERVSRAFLISPGGAVDSRDLEQDMESDDQRPGIAVLPFTNLSSDPEQEFFSEGISENIITALSKISGLKVISRTSTSIYKGKQVAVRQVGQEQGVC